VERVVLNALSKGTAALPPDIRAFGDPIGHRSGLDWHFQEKSTDPQQSLPLQRLRRTL
jgi:hypothetical protein